MDKREARRLWIAGLISMVTVLVIWTLGTSWEHWHGGWEEITALATSGLAGITATGFLFLSKQLDDGKRALNLQTTALISQAVVLQNQTRWQIYQLSFSFYKLLVDAPDLYPYLYQGKPLPPEIDVESQRERNRVLAAAELLLDYFEGIVLSRDTLDQRTEATWNPFMKEIYALSPAVQYLLEEKGHRFAEELKQALRSRDK